MTELHDGKEKRKIRRLEVDSGNSGGGGSHSAHIMVTGYAAETQARAQSMVGGGVGLLGGPLNVKGQC